MHSPPQATIFPEVEEKKDRRSHDSGRSSRRSYEYEVDSSGRRRGSSSTYNSTRMVAVEEKPPFSEKVRRMFGMQPKRYIKYVPAASTPAGTSMATYQVAPRTTGTTTYVTGTGHNRYTTYPTTSRTYAYATQPRTTTYTTGGTYPSTSRNYYNYPTTTGGTTYRHHRTTRTYSPQQRTVYPATTGGTTRSYHRTTRTTRY
ncbi:hypothetical protein FRC03_008135 [Tulasnella sp. 419]|nr:hypothetical protein FRC03_008135 [Tulasnella sp. 419]